MSSKGFLNCVFYCDLINFIDSSVLFTSFYKSVVPNQTPQPVSENCDACVKSFSEAGGCKCIENEECDQLSLIPDGCFKCGNKAIEYCSSQTG